MKIKVNTKIIKTLEPCSDRLDNWLKYYSTFDKDIIKFLKLKNITHHDKIWVTTKLIPLEMQAIFALDCSFTTYAANPVAYVDYVAYAAYTDYADDAANVASHTVYAATYADDDANAIAEKAEENRQIEALIYLIKGE